MNKKASFTLACLLIGTILVACGPFQAELDAQATQVAANLAATQTADVPTPTPPQTPTATSTNTPTLTPTNTPTTTTTPTNTSTRTQIPTPTNTATVSESMMTASAITETDTSQMSFDGTWLGTTSQRDNHIILVVEDNGIRSAAVQFDLPGGCALSITSVYFDQPQHVITGNTFSLTAANLTITGTFSADTSVSGALEITPGLCDGNVSATWDATWNDSDPAWEIITSTKAVALMPEIKIADGLFLPDAGMISYSSQPIIPPVLYSEGDWGLVASVIGEVIVPVPSGWTTVETVSEMFIVYSQDHNLEEPSILIRLGLTGFEGDNRTSAEVIAEVEAEVETNPNFMILRKEIIDTNKGYVFASVETGTERNRYQLALFSEHSTGWFHTFLVFTDQEDWNDYYPIIQAMAESWAELDGNRIGITLPETLVE